MKNVSFSPQFQDKDREYPNSHLIQSLCGVSFFIIWFLDSFILKFSIGVSSLIPFVIRLSTFLIILVIAIKLLQLAHDSLFNEREQESSDNPSEHHHPNKLIDTGIMAYIRHPLYLGVLLVYLAFVSVTLSISSLAVWIVIFGLYNKMASFEEVQLEIMFGKSYVDYKNRVPKWIPLNLFASSE